jgi:hypothetical protein
VGLALLRSRKKSGKNYAVFYFSGFFLHFFCYEVIVKQKKKKESRLYYWGFVLLFITAVPNTKLCA